MQSSQVRPTSPAVTRQRPVLMPGNRVPSFLHGYVNEARLTNWPVARVLRLTSLRCVLLRTLRPCQIVTPVTRHARCRAAECLGVIGPARPPRQSLRLVSRRPQRRRTSCAGRPSPLQPPRQASWHIGRDAASPEHGQRVRQASHRAPPSCAPVKCEGDLWGDLQAVGRETGSLLRLLKNPTHPPPLPVREGAMPTPRPPVGGSEEVRARGSVLRNPRPGSG